ncbi:MAG: PD-(D/E)XK nuclease family protein [Clostridia bacterium]|nr:PD-(D/E)XK nuclease family protein [Clostridia bacterium]
MVQFLYGDYGTGKSTYILEKIKEDAQKGISSFLIVPEQQTVIKERQIASLLPTAQLYCEVTNFTRLPNKVFREFGGLKDNYVTESGKILLMYQAICNCRLEGKLKSYKIEENHEKSSIKMFLKTIGEFKSYSVSMKKLDEAINGLGKYDSPKAMLDEAITSLDKDESPKAKLEDAINSLDKEDSLKATLEEIVNDLDKNISPKSKLESVINTLNANNSLKAKLEDLKEIWIAYEGLLVDKYELSDPYDNMTMLAEKIEEHNYFKGKNVYVDSFYGFSKAQLDVLEKIINSASNITFAFDCPTYATEETTQFSMIAKNARIINDICKKLGKQCKKPISFDKDLKHKYKDLKCLSKNLWDFSKEKISGSQNITLALCGDEFEECEYVASEICKLIMNKTKDYKYSDIAIIARNTSNYMGILNYTLKKYNIPHFFSAPSEWLTKPLIKMIFSALNFIDSHRREDLLTFAKCGYFDDITVDEISELESYLILWDIYGEKFQNPDYWNANPNGFSEEFDEEKLGRIIATKKRIFKKLEVLEKGFNGGGSVVDLATAVYNFLNNNKIVELLEEERKNIDKADAYVLSQIWDAILDALDTLAHICGDLTVDTSTFITLFNYAFLDANVGTIPTGEGNVIIADAHSIRSENIRHVFILGANEGVFPATVSDNSIFTDADKDKLKDKFQITLSATNKERADDELMFFKTSLAIASEGVHVCALTTAIDGSARQKSIGYKRIESLFKKVKRAHVTKHNANRKIFNENIASQYYCSVNGELKEAIANELKNRTKKVEKLLDEEYTLPDKVMDFSNENAELSSTTIDSVFGSTLRLSQTQLSLYSTCKFKYYIEQYLKLNADSELFFSSLNSGVLVHNIFEHFVNRMIEDENDDKKSTRKKVFDLSYDEIKEIIDDMVDKYVLSVCQGVHMSNKLLHHFDRLKRNLYIYINKLVEEFKQSEFKPKYTELNFGYKNDYRYKKDFNPNELVPPLTFDLDNGKKAYMIGTADRIDTYTDGDKVYIRVADYKIGSHKFSEAALKEGEDVQLPLYLFSLLNMDDGCDFKKRLVGQTDDGKQRTLVPAGFFFIPLNIGKLTIDDDINDNLLEMRTFEATTLEKESLFKGKFLDDEKIILAQDKSPGTKLLPSIAPKTKRYYYIPLDGFDRYRDLMTESITRLSNGIFSGKLETNPKDTFGKSACESCNFNVLCRRRNNEHE